MFIHDLSYTAACYGLDRWADQSVWYMYKYAMALEAIPSLAHSVASIIKSIFGRNKKVLALDMDNTLWGGVVGDDGPEGLELGEETPNGQAFLEFQRYVKRQKDIGVLLTVCSKNDPENALAGLRHPDSALSPDDFQVIRANWEPKDRNIAETARLLNLMTDSVVFADDNPAERHIVAASLPSTAVPAMEGVENYIRILDRNAYFEVTSLSADDLRRNEMYKENALREAERQSFADYSDYLRSLEMQGEIRLLADSYAAHRAAYQQIQPVQPDDKTLYRGGNRSGGRQSDAHHALRTADRPLRRQRRGGGRHRRNPRQRAAHRPVADVLPRAQARYGICDARHAGRNGRLPRHNKAGRLLLPHREERDGARAVRRFRLCENVRQRRQHRLGTGNRRLYKKEPIHHRKRRNNMNEIYNRLNAVFREVFDDESITVSENTTAADIEDWDSLTHIQLIAAVEDEFGVKFSMKQVSSMKNVGEMAQIIADAAK
ncbi:MAG: HAD-IIIC family phosphatase [Acutalibacteraceae bacterium]